MSLGTFGDLDPDDGRDLFLIENRCGGDVVLWWRDNACGYTTNLDEAGVYTRRAAESQERCREEDRAVPVHVARKAAHLSVFACDLRDAIDVG